MIKDLVSIVVPTYNDAPYLENALDDLINQTYKNIEIIVVNDGSTDETENILKKYSSNPIFKIINKANGGTGSALNAGFKLANGEFGTWVSSDDRKQPFLIEKLLNFLKTNRDVEYVVSSFYSQYLKSNFRSWIPDTSYKKGYRLNPSGISGEPCTNKSVIIDDWIPMNMIQCHSGVNYMFTMRLKNKCGEYLQIPGEDFNMAVKLGMNTRVGYIDEILGQHNNPIDSLSMQNRNCVIDAVNLTKDYVNKNYKHWYLEKIPKIANFYWGSKTMSYMRYMTIKSFKQMNPDWSVHLYVPDTVNSGKTWLSTHSLDNEDFSGKDYYEKLKNEIALKIIKVNFSKTTVHSSSEVHRSDYIRWSILHNTGGFWFDMDILFLKPLIEFNFNKPENKNLDCLVSFDERHTNFFSTKQMSIGVLMSNGDKNSFYGTILNGAKQQNNQFDYQSIGTNLIQKLGITSENYAEKFSDLNFHNLSNECFYLKDYLHLEDIFEKNTFQELLENKNVIGIHWYGGAEITKKYNNLINDETYHSFNNTFCEAIKFLKKE
jgi:glycosyltransferase involved in cell wall biosynthesis